MPSVEAPMLHRHVPGNAPLRPELVLGTGAGEVVVPRLDEQVPPGGEAVARGRSKLRDTFTENWSEFSNSMLKRPRCSRDSMTPAPLSK